MRKIRMLLGTSVAALAIGFIPLVSHVDAAAEESNWGAKFEDSRGRTLCYCDNFSECAPCGDIQAE